MTAVGQHIGFPEGTPVSGPGTVHIATTRWAWGVQKAECGVAIDVKHGWGRTHRQIDCKSCLAKVAVPA